MWFYGGSVVNFNHIDDPRSNTALDKGRSEPDPATRKGYYEDFNKRLSSQVYNFWTWYETVVHRPTEQRAGHPRPEPARRRPAHAGHREAGRRSSPAYHQLARPLEVASSNADE